MAQPTGKDDFEMRKRGGEKENRRRKVDKERERENEAKTER